MTGAASGAHEKLFFNTVNITQGGYLYVFVSNESNTDFEVYFDDLRITHTKGAILQEDTYYPFGLNISALSSTAPLSKPNQFKFNDGTEFNNDFDLGWYETRYRMYSPEIGRWQRIDPVPKDHESGYAWVTNNPMSYNDPLGLDTTKVVRDSNGELIHETILDDFVVEGDKVAESELTSSEISAIRQRQNRMLAVERMISDLAYGPSFSTEKRHAVISNTSETILKEGVDIWLQINGFSNEGIGDPDQIYAGRGRLPKFRFRGLSKGISLRSLTHADITKAFKGTGFKPSNHAIGRLKHIRTQKLGFNTLDDIAQIFRKGDAFHANDGLLGITYKGMTAIINAQTNVIVTFRPSK